MIGHELNTNYFVLKNTGVFLHPKFALDFFLFFVFFKTGKSEALMHTYLGILGHCSIPILHPGLLCNTKVPVFCWGFGKSC